MAYTRAKYKEGVPWENIKDPVGSIKWDGAHFFLMVGPTGDLSYISRRQGVNGNYPDRTTQLPQLASTKLPQFANQVFSVELIHTGHDNSPEALESHPDCSGILNSLPARAIETQKQTGPIRAILLDVIHPNISTYGEKMAHLQKVETAFGNSALMRTSTLHDTVAGIKALIERTKREKREGVIVTSKTLPEEKNVRVKIKHINTYNLKVVGITQEIDKSGAAKESAGALVMADATGRVVGNVGTGFTREQRRQIWLNKDLWMNSIKQVKAYPPTADKLRSPVYNGDADGYLDTVTI